MWASPLFVSLNKETPTSISRSSSYIDEYLLDIKSMDNEIHTKYTKTSNKKVLDNINYLSKKIDTNKISISVPIIPNINDSEENILDIISFMKKNNLKNINLLPYRDYVIKKYDNLNLKYELNENYNQTQYIKLLNIVNNSFL